MTAKRLHLPPVILPSEDELLAGKAEASARAKFALLRGVCLQCGHTEAEMINGDVSLDDAWMLANAMDGSKSVGNDGVIRIRSHPLADTVRENILKDGWVDNQKAAQAIVDKFPQEK